MPHEAAWSDPFQRNLVAIDGRLRPGPEIPETLLEMEGISPQVHLTSKLPVGLLSLHKVSRMFNELCAPYIYRELNIHEHNYRPIEPALILHEAQVTLQPHHVRSIRIYLGTLPRKEEEEEAETFQSIAEVLKQCHQITSLALYYQKGKRKLGGLQEEICRYMERSQLINFGIYSLRIMQASKSTHLFDDEQIDGALEMLNAALGFANKDQSLQRLDIVMESMDMDEIKLLQGAKGLRTLTVRRALRSKPLASFDVFNMERWKVTNKLTRLYLGHCQPAHAEKMIGLVQYFPALEELMWAISGHYADRKTPRPPPGWSNLEGCLPKTRRPLKLLHIEHAMEWEVFTLGQIPVEEVIVANAQEQIIQRVLASPTETFIGMKTLRVLPVGSVLHSYVSVTDDDRLGDDSSDLVSLDESCARRNVTLRHDAQVLFPCSCCYWTSEQPVVSEDFEPLF
ncbi:hypothetical protein FRC18_011023 [Serendipita sp. 400]|nr:hypothetical protein FRC18_011023 [Serendipita sp. 400]